MSRQQTSPALAPGVKSSSAGVTEELRLLWGRGVGHRLGRALRSPVGVATACLPLLVGARQLWVAQVCILLVLLTMPGVLALRAVGLRTSELLRMPIYIVASSLFLLMSLGLLLNTVGPAIGIARPLTVVPVAVGVEVLLIVLGVVAVRRAPRGESTAKLLCHSILHPRGFAGWLPFLLPALAAFGAMRLNTGNGNGAAVLACVAASGALLFAVVCRGRLRPSSIGLILFCGGLAMMWSFSLRGDSVYGFDIHSEYALAEETAGNGTWHAAHPGDPYGAMLSITILPALLHAVSGMSTGGLLRLVYPALFALVPLAVFGLCRRMAPPGLACLSGVLLIAQAAFVKGFPALARQEIGVIFFVALLAVILDGRLRRGARYGLVATFSLGMVVTHYSTTYLAVTLFALALLPALAVTRRRTSHEALGGLALAVVVCAAGVGVWNGAITRSAGDLERAASLVRQDGLNLLPTAGGGSLVSSYLNGNVAQTLSAAEYERAVVRGYATLHPYIQTLPGAGSARYRLLDDTVRGEPRRGAVRATRLAELIAAQGLNLALVAATLLIATRRRWRRRAAMLGMLGLAAIAVLVLMRLSGTAARLYNQERALLQTMIPLSIALAFALGSAGRRRRSFSTPARLLGVIAFVLVISSSGLAARLSGGAAPANISSSGEDVERFAVSRAELAAGRWLVSARPPDGVIQADRYGALRLLGIDRTIEPYIYRDLVPQVIDRHAWVFASHANAVRGRARSSVDEDIATYRFPTAFLDDWFDRVYSNGSSAVYTRRL